MFHFFLVSQLSSMLMYHDTPIWQQFIVLVELYLWGISTHWATYVFSSQLLDALDQNSLLLTDLDPRDLEYMCAARHPDKESETETKEVVHYTFVHLYLSHTPVILVGQHYLEQVTLLKKRGAFALSELHSMVVCSIWRSRYVTCKQNNLGLQKPSAIYCK